jgi:hypothetical protein
MTEPSEPTVMDLDNWQRLKSMLPVGWMEIATRNGVGTSAQEPHNASGVGPEAKLRTLLTMVAWNLSLRAVSGLFAGAGLHDVSHVGIHGWLKRSVPAFEEFRGRVMGRMAMTWASAPGPRARPDSRGVLVVRRRREGPSTPAASPTACAAAGERVNNPG